MTEVIYFVKCLSVCTGVLFHLHHHHCRHHQIIVIINILFRQTNGKLRKLHNEELCKLYSPVSII